MAAPSLASTPACPDERSRLALLARAPAFVAYQSLGSSPSGLTEAVAAERAAHHGPNRPGRYLDDRASTRLREAASSPFVALLAVFGVVLVVVGDAEGAATVAVVVTATVGLRLWQQSRAVRALRGLRRRTTTTVTVRRRAADGEPSTEREVAVEDLVPGDVVVLGVGDLVPADLRIVASTGLTVDQAVVSGESRPVPKGAPAEADPVGFDVGFDTASLCFTGTTVVTGAATALVVATGTATVHDALTRTAVQMRPRSSFDLGVRTVGLVLIRFMLVMAPIVFVVNGWVRGDWHQAAMFAIAVAIGLTPEMLPVIVTANLARGAATLAGRGVVVNRLEAIQDLGAMDVLCVDETGTLTEDRVVYAHGLDARGVVDDSVGDLAHLAVSLQACPHDVLDEAIVARLGGRDPGLLAEAERHEVDEIVFDHVRRMATVVVRRWAGRDVVLTHGDPVEVLARCDRLRLGGEVVDFDEDRRAAALAVVRDCGRQGTRTLAVATRDDAPRLETYSARDEFGLVLVGFVGFVDPVRDGVDEAVETLAARGVTVKILTGDGEDVACTVAHRVGLPPGDPVLGPDVDAADDDALAALVDDASVFARLTPAHKVRIVGALRAGGHTVGFVGDGVNDVPALRVADAGIAVDGATDAAKAAADLILLGDRLGVLAEGVVEGRRTLANTMKYVKITASSNFGNVISVMVAAAVLPFLPMLPVQLIVQNLLYDGAQLALAWDRAEADYLRSPQRWNPRGLVRFMLWFGPLSSVFDLATFAVFWWGFGAADRPATFHTGWFLEGLLTQLLVVLVLRVRGLPWGRSRPARPVVLTALGATIVGITLPATPLGSSLGMVELPVGYVLWIAAVTVAYALAAQAVKLAYLRRRDDWL